MLETLQQFEQVAAGFSPAVLLIPGIVTGLIGLFVWLGGFGFNRVSTALVGAIGGGTLGFFLAGGNVAAAAVSAGIVAFVAFALKRLFIGSLAAVLAVVFGFALLAGQYFDDAGGAAPAGPSGTSEQDQRLSISESVETAKLYVDDFRRNIDRARSRMPVHTWIVIIALAVTSAAAAFFLWRFASALCCSVLGTMLIFLGLILLLLWKGSMPISRIHNRAAFYGLVFLGMAAFGTVEQLLLLLRTKRQAMREEQAKADEEELQGKQRWRSD
ncbi:MAG: hypothetical protein JSU70_17290 [Phycisphaerales bacterium]|nr:MAG: hypothetical protein JSU70_17290 [Phycisphaerales bacterium]